MFRHIYLNQKSLEVQNTMVLKRLRQLFKFCQNASHIWDLHEIGLAKQEKLLQEKLDEVRTKNDIVNHVNKFAVLLFITMNRTSRASRGQKAGILKYV